MTPRGFRAAVLVASGRCARGDTGDSSRRHAAGVLATAGFDVAEPVVVTDGAASVSSALGSALAAGAERVVTSGGTGVGPRDETPEGTRPVLAKELPGIAEALRGHGYARVPTAALSRGLAGVTADGAL